MKAVVYTQLGEKKGDVSLNSSLFGAPIREGLMHEAMVRQFANARVDTAFTKTKGEVSGGGRKPYRQKGTGRARQGSITNPHYRGGGVAFGPRGNRNYEISMPKKQRRAALFSALSLRARDEEILVLDKFELPAPKTKAFADMLLKLPVKRNVLLVISEKNMVLQKSCANLENVRSVYAQYLSVVDLLNADTVIFLESALKKAEETFLK